MADLSRRRRRRAGLWVMALCGLAAFGQVWQPAPLRAWQERAFDAVILLAPAPASTGLRVIDIGRTDETGVPWSRAASARLAARLAEAGPAVIGWDIVFSGGCGPEAANLALGATLARAPAVLGFLLSPSPAAPPGQAALVLAEGLAATLWIAPGAENPCPAFIGSRASLGAISLPGDSTARVRLVPALVGVGAGAWPSLPVEVWRRAQGTAPAIVSGPAQMPMLHLDGAHWPLAPGGMLRFRPQSAENRAARTLAAADVLAGRIDAAQIRGAIVLVGSSAPQAGGLRPVSNDPLYPSVQIAADVIAGLQAGRLPWRPARAGAVEGAALALAGLGLALAVAWLAPLAAAALALAAALGWAGLALALHWHDGRLIDPLLPPVALALSAALALLAQAVATARAEAALRRRMGQLLPVAVVARLADRPDLMRLKGERREVTALFTDLEGFSAATHRMQPEALIALLDRYFAVINAAILAEGGMIDKIVGDAVHALFNAPLDQPGHPDAALRAARAIQTATDGLRATMPDLGRTRIGIETGPAILGDVGGGTGAGRIDYTAHGPCVNLAARLQDAGKRLGPAVIIGPGTASAARTGLVPLGRHDIRGFGEVELFTLAPVPPGTAGAAPGG